MNNNHKVKDELYEESVVISTFYHFINLPNFEDLKDPLLDFCEEQGMKGTILLAAEGLNSTISGTRQAIDNLYLYLQNLGVEDLYYKESFADFMPFLKMKVRLKKEIVAMGIETLDLRKRGQYIEPKDWDEFINREDVIVIDTRNDYEIMLGRFKNAIDPETTSFRQFPRWAEENLSDSKNKKIAMYCTGGVRCEKSTALLKNMGFPEVYHLRGGILQYFEDTQNANQQWEGSCFVFDDRVAVSPSLIMDEEILCHKCQKSMNTDDVRAAADVKEIVCQECTGKNL